MRTFVWLIALLVNSAVIAAFSNSMLAGDIVGFIVSALFVAIGVLLVAARVERLPSWGHAAMKLLCWAVPVLSLVASFDYGMVSGQEVYSLIFAVLLGWGSWRTFLLFDPTLNLRSSGKAQKRAPP